jgi:hypothetical protein
VADPYVSRSTLRARLIRRPAPTERLFIDLQPHLSRFIGVYGYKALVTRALHLAEADFPVLSGVRPGVSSPGRLVGLRRGRRRARAVEVHAAVTATLMELLRLLDQLIGQDMTQRIVSDAWPGVSDGRFGLPEPRRLTG